MKPNWIAALSGAFVVVVTFSLAFLEGANAAADSVETTHIADTR